MSDNDAQTAEATKRATIVDVGVKAGVSTAAVSKVLRNAYGVSDAMRTRVHAAMAELDYRPDRLARGMRGRTFSIGMMVSDLENPYFNLLADGISAVMREEGYELLVSPGGVTAESQTAAINSLIDHRMDGLILIAPFLSEESTRRVASVPTVVVGTHTRNPTFDSVSGDDEAGAALVVEHLAGLGHERIAFVSNDMRPSERGRPESARLRGFTNAMRARDLEPQIIKSQWHLEGGRQAARMIAQMDVPPTAVHAGADIVAFGIMSELWEHGERVPESLSVVGYDNSWMSSVGPLALTTVDQAGLEMGRVAGALLLERIGGRSTARHELLKPTLVTRGTTAQNAPSPG